MLILYISATVLALFLAACAMVLSFKANEIKKRRHFLNEALWARRHLIPLLIESGDTNKDVQDAKKEIIKLRAAASKGAALQEQIGIEKQMSHYIRELLHKIEADRILMADAQFLSVKKEYVHALEQIDIAINDFNFEVQEFSKYIRFPWFRIFVFLFKVRFFKSLQNVE